MSDQLILVKSVLSSLLLSFLLSVTFVSCNDDKTKTAEQTDTSTSSTTGTSPTTGAVPKKLAAAALSDFPVLCISKTDLESYYSSGQVFKLVFNVTLDDSKTLNPSLTIYKSRANGEFIGGAVKTLDAYDEPWPIEGISYLGNLELTRTYYFGTLEPKAGAKPSLLFYPVKSGDGGNRVTYKLLWGDCSTLPAVSFTKEEVLAAADQLNPCPPNQPGQ